MHPPLFLSYSRREVPFVNGLQGHLENSGYEVWLDYHDIIPGSPWLEQIFQGIAKAEIFLLVISQASMASQNVEAEWQKAVALKKRIILIIFEAVELPEPLKRCEWIDFRSSFKTAAATLIAQIANPQVQNEAPPENGFKAPKIVWTTFAISIIISICSIFSFWTVYVPYYLVPLPYKILKRDFSFSNVQTSSVLLPFTLFWSFGFFISFDGTDHEWLSTLFFLVFLVGTLISPIFLILIRLKSIQQWGKPIASRPKFSKLYRPKKEELKPITFTIDSAPEDKRYARAIVRNLERHGHHYIVPEKAADVGIVLLSSFKTDSHLDPEKQIVYPVILQKTSVADPRLKRIQWIDFRRGTKNMKSFCFLLSQPEKMVKALGIVPPGRQTVLPKIIQGTSYYLLLMCVFQLGSILTLLPQSLIVSIPNIQFLIFSASIFIAISMLMHQSLITRKGFFNSIAYLWLSLLFLGGLVLTQFVMTAGAYTGNSDQVPSSMPEIMLGFSSNMTFSIHFAIAIIYALGLALVFFGTILSWQDLRRWLYK